jgi:hypothetical protein
MLSVHLQTAHVQTILISLMFMLDRPTFRVPGGMVVRVSGLASLHCAVVQTISTSTWQEQATDEEHEEEAVFSR